MEFSIRFTFLICPIAIVAVLSSQVSGAQVFPAEFDLTELHENNGGDGSDGFVIRRSGSDNEGVGTSVSAAGDINGDGVGDVMIRQQILGEPSRVYVVFGSASGFAAEFNLQSLEPSAGGDGSAGFVMVGIDSGTGLALATPRDVNNDQIDDLMIGGESASPVGRNGAGETYVIYGSNAGFPPLLELSSLHASLDGIGSVFNGAEAGDGAGFSARGAGDFNGDGIADLLIGAPYADPAPVRRQAGKIYIVYGTNLGFPPQFELLTLPASGGAVMYGEFGASIPGTIGNVAGSAVSAGGDINGDGFDDVIIGAPYYAGYDGRAYVVFGTNIPYAAPFELLTLEYGGGIAGFAVEAVYENQIGSAVGSVDINNDGFDDVVIGADAPGWVEAQDVYVIYGTSAGFPGQFDLASLLIANGGDGSTGFVIQGAPSFFVRLQQNGLSATDLNGDGAEDLVLAGAGRTYVLYGGTTGFGAEFDMTALNPVNGGDGSAGFMLTGPNLAGLAVSDAGDVNGDGVGDIVIGSWVTNVPNAGAYVVFGRRDTDTDGVHDAVDNCPTVPNSDQLDQDDDAVGNRCDNCTFVANEAQCDTNGDGFGNMCDADINNNNVINFVDLSLMKNVWMSADADADLNCNGVVNFADLALLKGMWLNSPGPSGIIP